MFSCIFSPHARKHLDSTNTQKPKQVNKTLKQKYIINKTQPLNKQKTKQLKINQPNKHEINKQNKWTNRSQSFRYINK